MRGVFTLFEGLPPTVIDSQVLTHVRLMRERAGIDMAVAAFACTDAIYDQAQSRLDSARSIAGGPVFLFRGVRPGLPGSSIVNRRRLVDAIRTLEKLDFLHVRGDYAASVAGPLARRLRVPMLWDCRGDAVAEILERRANASLPQRALLTARAFMARREARYAGIWCTAACFVSKPLRDLMAPFTGSKPGWVLSCLANEEEFFFDPALRAAVRARLGFSAADEVYVYLGSLVGYQKFSEVVSSFAAIARAVPTSRLIVLTPDADAAWRATSALPQGSVTCAAVTNGEVNGYLNAADFGFLLRDNSPVNRVAFPTKFAEYALTGLKIVMKDDPPSCVEVARMLGNYIAPGMRVPAYDQAARAACAAGAVKQMGRGANIRFFSDIYRSLARSPA